MKLKRYNDISESHSDDEGGITNKEYDEIVDFVGKLKERTKNEIITDEDKILSEIFYSLTKEKDKLDFKSFFMRRLDTIRGNRIRQRKRGVETVEFRDLVWWLQDAYEWSYVEAEGIERVRFDWNGGNNSFYLNSDLTIKGFIPEELREQLIEKGITLDKN